MEPKATETLGDPCPPKTRSDLEWDRILDAIADRCRSATGKRLAKALPFAGSHAEVLRSLSEVREASELDALGDPVPVGDTPEVEGAIERARIGASLTREELLGVLSLLGAARALRRFLDAHRDLAPTLFEACSTDPELDELKRELGDSFDPDGTLADKASPKLAELRSELRLLRHKLVRRLEELSRKHEDILQDTFVTERDGRYVLPVRSDAHERFPGIVHAYSSSGATVFVEPRALVDMGNRLKILDAQVTAEEEVIYAALTALVADAVTGISHASAALAHADVRAASARLAKDLRLTFPEVPASSAEPPSIELIAARHPLLALDGVNVVPSDVAIAAGRAMIVSGPNAGGKTVVLKTLGLAALMVRAGLPVPASQGSRVSAFEAVLTDVGDDQNLRKNLSTFSAHIQNIAQILDASHSGVLVLLDELAGGTDPREGEALAAAVLDSLCARGGAAVCTTHYEGLKALALGDPRFVNASVGFDLATMNPTFRLAVGIPGASSALAVAKRFGIPGTVLERAERFLSRETVTFEQMVEKLAAERRALEIARAAAEREADEARRKQRDLDRERERLADKERVTITKEGEDLLQSLRRARDDLRAAQARLRAGKLTDEDIRAASSKIDAVAQKVAIGGELSLPAQEASVERRALDPGSIRVGTRVYIPRLRAEADVVEVLPSGALRVAAGPLKLMTSVNEVRSAGASSAEAATAKSKGGKGGKGGASGQSRVVFDAAADPDVPIQTSENTIDLRGLRAHEAIAMAEQFLDRSLGAGRKVAFLIHGHGTGALRDGLRDALRGSRAVEKMRPGGPSEGGDGVTVIWLRW